MIALDARMRVTSAAGSGEERLAIRPYPQELEERVEFHGRELLLRPIRPGDEPQHARFLELTSPEDLQLRFFHAIRYFPHEQLARFTQIDYDREMAFIAVARDGAGPEETLGVVRAIADPDRTGAEFAILVRSDMKGRGLGMTLMKKIVRYCRERGIGELTGEVMATNLRMIALARELGFEIVPGESPDCLRLRLQLTRNAGDADARSGGVST